MQHNPDVNQEEVLKEVLELFQDVFNSNPLAILASIPKAEYWRFFINFNDQDIRDSIAVALNECDDKDLDLPMEQFIDAHCEWGEFLKEEGYNVEKHGTFSFREYSNLQRGWAPYEDREPGYLKGLIAAFNFMLHSHLNNQPEQPSIDFIKHIHLLAAGDVKKTNYDINDELAGVPGEFRKIPDYVTYQLSINNMSFNGLCELAKKISEQHLPLIFIVKNPDLERDDQIPLCRVNTPEKSIPLGEIYLGDILGEPDKYAHILSEIYERFGNSPANDQDNLFLGSMLAVDPQEAMTKSLNFLLQTYQYALYHADTPEEKLTAIVTFVQDCDQLHPFIDVNIRSFVFILLNHLLIMNGFPPSIMHDPNHFDGFSVAELVKEVIHGMKIVLAMATHEIEFEYTTDMLFAELSEEEKKYFNLFVGQVTSITLSKPEYNFRGVFFPPKEKQLSPGEDRPNKDDKTNINP